eukprot:COSAG02_NODE_15487_length_1166_cov_1.830366_1_plen_279_part_10
MSPGPALSVVQCSPPLPPPPPQAAAAAHRIGFGPTRHESYLSLVATNPWRGSVWGGKTITELQACQRRLALAIGLCEGSMLIRLDYDVLVRLARWALRGITCYEPGGDDGSQTYGPSVESCPLTRSFCSQDARLRRQRLCSRHIRNDTLTAERQFVKLQSHWSRWAAFGPKGTWQGGQEEPPSAKTFPGVMATLHQNGESLAASDADDTELQEEHVRAIAQMLSKHIRSQKEKVKLPHVHRFFAARSAEEKHCLKGMLHDGFNEAVHGNISDAVEGVAE